MNQEIPHIKNGRIPVFYLKVFNIELEFNNTNDDLDFIYVGYAAFDKFYAAMDDPSLPSSTSESVDVD